MRLNNSLSILACCLACGHTQAATFSVTNIDNAGPGSLRQALLTANATSAPPHRIEFHPDFPQLGTIELFSPLPMIQVPVEIDGNGRNPSVTPFDPSNSFPLLRSSKALTVKGLSLSRGRANERGGCIGAEGASSTDALIVDSVNFHGCLAAVSTGGTMAEGGAIAWAAGAPVTVIGSVFQGNGAASLSTGPAGGGALSVSGRLRVESSYFYGNIANGPALFGGAIKLSTFGAQSADIVDSVFVGNLAVPETSVASPQGAGGAISLDCAPCTVSMQRVYFGENASDYAGAVFLRGTLAQPSQASLQNVTFVNNRATAWGGAVYTNGARLDLRHTTFAYNTGGTGGHLAGSSSSIGEWSNSVLAEVGQASDVACSMAAQASIAVGNIAQAGDNSCRLILPGTTYSPDLRIVGIDDGDHMPVVVFAANGPAVDGGDDGRCLPHDARGRSRPQDGNGDGLARCDAGAHEAPASQLFQNGFEP